MLGADIHLAPQILHPRDLGIVAGDIVDPAVDGDIDEGQALLLQQIVQA